MKPFEYLEPRDLAEACTLIAEHREEAKIIAGGQSLVPILKQRLIRPRYVINIKGLSDLDYIKEEADRIRIGALTTHWAIETSPLIKKRFPILAKMEQRLGMVQIRNWGTIGGNLCHADPAGDPAPPLIALDAKVKVRSVRGERQIALNEFFVDYLETVLEPDEILVEIEVPYTAPNTCVAFMKEQVRASDMAIAAVSVAVTLDGKLLKDARIVLGAVGGTPIRSVQAEKTLVGKSVTTVSKDLHSIAAIAADEAQPSADVHGSVEYKRHLVKVLTKSAVKEAVSQAQEVIPT